MGGHPGAAPAEGRHSPIYIITPAPRTGTGVRSEAKHKPESLVGSSGDVVPPDRLGVRRKTNQ